MGFISNGTTMFDNGALVQSAGSLILLSTATASGSASISFTSGIDSTYPIYKFEFISIHPSINNEEFTVGFRDGGTNYDAVKTTTVIDVYHAENDTFAGLSYGSSDDLAQSTAFQIIAKNVSNDSDGSCSGTLTLFNPSSTTYVKHFISNSNKMESGVTAQFLVAGYCNVTAAIDAVQFKFNSGNIDAGTIKLYGIAG